MENISKPADQKTWELMYLQIFPEQTPAAELRMWIEKHEDLRAIVAPSHVGDAT